MHLHIFLAMNYTKTCKINVTRRSAAELIAKAQLANVPNSRFVDRYELQIRDGAKIRPSPGRTMEHTMAFPDCLSRDFAIVGGEMAKFGNGHSISAFRGEWEGLELPNFFYNDLLHYPRGANVEADGLVQLLCVYDYIYSKIICNNSF